MILADVIDLVYQEINAILTSANLENGDLLAENVIKENLNILFYETKIKTVASSQKDTYIIYSIEELPVIAHGDDNVAFRIANVILDIWSRKRRDYPKNKELIRNINDNAIALGWEFELSLPVDYDATTKMYNFQYIMKKRF